MLAAKDSHSVHVLYKDTEVYRSVCCAVLVLNFVGDSSSNQSPSVLVPALRTVGNIVTGNDMQTQVGCRLQLLCVGVLLALKHGCIIKGAACFLGQ
jgi:hypothetical protein